MRKYRINEQKEQLVVFQSNQVLPRLTLLFLLLRADFPASEQLDFVTGK